MSMQTTSRQPSLRELAGALPIGLFRALGDTNRLALLAWLARQREPRTVSDVVASGCCHVDFSVVSRHLKTLHEAGVLQAERRGREVFYRLPVEVLVRCLRDMADTLERCCGSQAGQVTPSRSKE
jgi:ArsR family transcriptional regulator, arsenate/arsenite/antimonite-responsive transcriptional repressor